MRSIAWHSLVVVCVPWLITTVFSAPAHAQITPDSTLGTRVFGDCRGTGGACGIINGTTRGSNLFHSFQQFSLPGGGFAGFLTTPNIQNVIVRVTGVGQPSISNINGTIATLDTTLNPVSRNFFLLNPNGIIFGPSARILVGGSFLATTAERMLFQDGTVFDTRDRPSNSLLTISTPIGLQFGSASGAIQSSFRISSASNSQFTDFALLGGDVTLNNAFLFAPGHRITIEGVGENSRIALQLNGDRLSSTVAPDASRRDLTFDRSAVNAVDPDGGGEIMLGGRNVFVSQSSILTGIAFGITNVPTNQAGDLTVNATETLRLTQNSAIGNIVGANATGQGGNINVTALTIQAREGSEIATNTFGKGNAGNVQVTANSILLDGSVPGGISAPSGIYSQVSSNGNGNSGDIFVNTNALTVTNGAIISAFTFGNGNGGNLQVTANTITLDGTTPFQRPGGIGSEVSGVGNGGDVLVRTNSLTVLNGAVVSASTFGIGNAGDVKVVAKDIRLDGTATNGQFSSAIRSEVVGAGQGGNVEVQADSLTVTNGGQVSANNTGGIGNAGNVSVTAKKIVLNGTKPNQNPGGIGSEVAGRGNGGTVVVQADSLTILNGAVISANMFGNGDAGSISITANEISLDGTSTDGRSSAIRGGVGQGGMGKGGDITVQTGTLTITNGGAISVSTLGSGDAGSIRVDAKTITVDGTSQFGSGASVIASGVEGLGKGRSGDVTIQTDSLNVRNGGAVYASTFSTGNAGSVRVNANSINLDGFSRNGQFASAIASAVLSTGNGQGGDVLIETDSLSIKNGANIIASTFGTGDAGNVRVKANFITLDGVSWNGRAASTIASSVSATGNGQGGDVNVQTASLFITKGANISATTFGIGDAGNVRVDADSITLDGISLDGRTASGIFSEVGGIGRGGNVTVEAGTLTVTNRAQLSASTFNQGDAGNLAIHVRGTASFDNNTRVSSNVQTNAIGNGGNLSLTAQNLFATNGAQFSAGTFGRGNGGNLTIHVRDTAIFAGEDATKTFPSGAFSSAEPGALGNSGNLQISARRLILSNSANLRSSSRNTGLAGDIIVSADEVTLDRGRIFASTLSGDGGNITLNVQDLLQMRRGSQISATAGLAGTGGDGGNITVESPQGFLVSAPNENNDITANAFSGSGGRITINATGIYWFTPRSRADLIRLLQTPPFDALRLPTNDITASSELGIGGTITLNTPNLDPSRGLSQLPQNLIDTNQILANSCIVRDAASGGTFLITGSGGMPEQPGTLLPRFSTGEVRRVGIAEGFSPTTLSVERLREQNRSASQNPTSNIQNSEAISEAQDIYKLPDGQIILSWKCR